MTRLLLVIAVAAAVLGLTLAHVYWLALSLGVAVGAAMFLLGMAAGGGLGNARAYGRRPADVGARIGVALAAMGIAVEGLRADGPYPPPFQMFCQACQWLGAVIAVVLAVRYRHPTAGNKGNAKTR